MNHLINWCRVFVGFALVLGLEKGGHAQTALFLRGGVNLNKPSGATNANIGLHGGIGISFPLLKNWKLFLQPEFAFVHKGYTTYDFAYFGHQPESNRLFHVRMTYTEFPLLLRREFVLARNTRFYLLAGPSLWSRFRNLSLTYTVDGQQRQQNEFGTTVDWLQKDLASKTTPIDLVVNAGAGFNVGLGRHRLGLEARYGSGTKRIGNSHPDFHRTLSLSAVYFLTLGKP